METPCNPHEPTRNHDVNLVKRQIVSTKQGIQILFLHSVFDAKHLVVVADVPDRILRHCESLGQGQAFYGSAFLVVCCHCYRRETVLCHDHCAGGRQL